MADLVLAVVRGLRPVEVCLFLVSCALQARLVAPQPQAACNSRGKKEQQQVAEESQAQAPAEGPLSANATLRDQGPAPAAGGASCDSPQALTSPPPLLALAAPVLGLTRFAVTKLPFAKEMALALGEAVTRAALTPVAGALTATHLLLEGARWQLFGLYAATGGAALCQHIRVGGVARLVAGACCACCTAVTACATWAFPFFKLPAPTGPYRCAQVHPLAVLYV